MVIHPLLPHPMLPARFLHSDRRLRYHVISFLQVFTNSMNRCAARDVSWFFFHTSTAPVSMAGESGIKRRLLNAFSSGRVDTSVTRRIPHRIPDMRLFRIRLFTKLIVHQLFIDTDIDFRSYQGVCIINHLKKASPRVAPFLTSSIKPVKETFKYLVSKGS